MTTRDIRAHLREMYDTDVSPDLISPVTYGVLEELTEWQAPGILFGAYLGIRIHPAGFAPILQQGGSSARFHLYARVPLPMAHGG
jgi:hypothetical protein